MIPARNSILLLGLLSAFSLLTFDLYQPSLPFITHFFNTNASLSQLTLSIYLFVFGVSQLIWGPLIDHFGRRRVLFSSLILALVASLLCAYAMNIYVLIFGRALQGFSLCCSQLLSLSASRDVEDNVERAKLLSYISIIVAVSPIFAPVLGSIIFVYLGWQANFLIMAIIAIILLYQSYRHLVESPYWLPPTKPLSPKEIVTDYQVILPEPFLWCGAMIMMFSFAAVMISVVNASYLIIDRLGFSPFAFGLIFIFNGLNIIVGNYLGIWLRQLLSMHTNIYLGNLLIIVGGLGLLIMTYSFGFSLTALSFCLISNLGISLSAPPTMSLTLAHYKNNTGTTVAFINTLRMMGSSLLAMTIGYYLIQNLNALAYGLIGCGLSALYFTWHFTRLLSAKTIELDPLFNEA